MQDMVKRRHLQSRRGVTFQHWCTQVGSAIRRKPVKSIAYEISNPTNYDLGERTPLKEGKCEERVRFLGSTGQIIIHSLFLDLFVRLSSDTP